MSQENESLKATHLSVLICYSIFTIILAAESVVLGWNIGAVVLLGAGMILCWCIHITTKVPVQFRIWIYFTMSMLAFFFYGIQATSLYDLAPVMIFGIIVFSSVEKHIFITLCVVVYFLTILYNILFVSGNSFVLTPLSVSRMATHLLLIYVSSKLIKAVITRGENRLKTTEAKIAELEEVNHRTEDFLANISHELRTPINVVTGITSVLMKNEDNPAKRNDIHMVQMAGFRLFSQIEDILEYTEIETGRLKVFVDDYMISSIVNDIITSKRPSQEENPDLELIFDVDAGIPSVLNGDEKKIKRIIWHLLDNALKFTKQGGVYVRIHTIRKPYGVNLCIQVRDTGAGISEKDLIKIKERFYQSNPGRDRSTGGLGLGLPIVYGLVSAMDGFIRVESEVGKGTSFFVSIPQCVSDHTPSIYLADKTSLSLALFLRMDRYFLPEVRDFYNEMIAHIIQGLDVSVHRIFDISDLKKLISMYHLSHLFIGKDEYEENQDYFEKTGKNTAVVVVADKSFTLPPGSNAKILRKPFYFFSVVNILNTKREDNPFRKMRMLCPGVRMLVVDDEPMNLMVAEGIFRDYQMNVTLADSGKKALAICETEDFDLIFLDHMMPEMDGVETLKRLRKLYTVSNRQLTVVAFTANAVSDAREMFLREGFDEFVSKPIDTLELERVLRKILPKSMLQFVEENSEAANSYEHYATIPAPVSTEEAKQTASGISNPAQNSSATLLTAFEDTEINTQNGLQYCRGDINFYSELLLKFAEDATEKRKLISSYYDSLDFENYRILVHALKSTAKMIGADSLSEFAKKMEDAAKNKDEAFITSNEDSLMQKYAETVSAISNALSPRIKNTNAEKSDATERAQKDGSISGEKISKEDFLQALEELKNSLDTFEADKAESLIDNMSLKIYKEKNITPLLKEIEEDVDSFEISAAAEKLNILIQNIEGDKL